MFENYIGKKVTLVPKKPKEFIYGTVKDFDGEFVQLERVLKGTIKPSTVHKSNIALLQER